MINRIRVVTLLVMVLGVFALLQLISGSLFFSSLHHSQKSFVVSNQLREQQGELTSTWDLMLQTRINLSRSAVRMMMDSSNQQSNAKVEQFFDVHQNQHPVAQCAQSSEIFC